MAYSSEFSCVSASPKYVCDGDEWRLGFSAFVGWSIFPLAYVDVNAPSDFRGVSSGSVWGVGVRMDGVVCSRFSSFPEDVTIYGAGVLCVV